MKTKVLVQLLIMTYQYKNNIKSIQLYENLIFFNKTWKNKNNFLIVILSFLIKKIIQEKYKTLIVLKTNFIINESLEF